jgi:hypothetical protein
LCQKEKSPYNIRNLPSSGRLLPNRFVPLTKAAEKEAGFKESMNCG